MDENWEFKFFILPIGWVKESEKKVQDPLKTFYLFDPTDPDKTYRITPKGTNDTRHYGCNSDISTYLYPEIDSPCELPEYKSTGIIGRKNYNWSENENQNGGYKPLKDDITEPHDPLYINHSWHTKSSEDIEHN